MKVSLNSDMSIGITTDLYFAALTECGSPYHAECYRIVVEFEDGTRLAHFKEFRGCVVLSGGEDGIISFVDVREQVKRDIESLLKRITEYGVIDLEYWSEISPRYGSKRYQQQHLF